MAIIDELIECCTIIENEKTQKKRNVKIFISNKIIQI